MKKIVEKPYTMDIHGNITYTKPPEPEPIKDIPITDTSLDDIGKRIINALDLAVKQLSTLVSGKDVSREVIGALKDCQMMLKDLKKDEKDFLDKLTEEELEALLKKSKSKSKK